MIAAMHQLKEHFLTIKCFLPFFIKVGKYIQYLFYERHFQDVLRPFGSSTNARSYVPPGAPPASRVASFPGSTFPPLTMQQTRFP